MGRQPIILLTGLQLLTTFCLPSKPATALFYKLELVSISFLRN
jgi:hypothetical protein